MSGGRRQSGFTLLELILALAMTAMLAASLYASLRIGFKARDAAMRAIGPVRAVSIAMDMIGHDLESALPPNGILAGPFEGMPAGSADNGSTSDTVEFYCVGEGPDHPDPTGWGGIRRIDLGVTTLADGTDNVLVRQITSNLLSQMTVDPDVEVICRGVKSFTMLYYDGETWTDTWDSTQLGNVLPMAVMVTLEIQWPPPKPDDPPPGPDSSYKMTRIYYLPCHQDADPTQSGTTGAAGGAAGGAGGGPGTGGGNTGLRSSSAGGLR